MSAPLNNSQQFKIMKAEISADRFGDNVIDVRTLISELNLFESLENPYISGNMLLIDDKGLVERLDFKGTEVFTLEVASVAGILEVKIGGEADKAKKFILTRIEKSVRNNDRSETVLINFIEEHFFFDKLIKISKSFTSNLEGMISEILVGSLNKSVDLSYITKSAQGVRKINIPFLHPLEAVDWLRDRMTTDVGGPFFTHASVFDNNIRLSSLDGLLSQRAFNSKAPFIYSAALAQKADDLSEDQKSLLIEDFKIKLAGDSLKLISQGGVGSQYTNTDIGTGLTTQSHFSVRDLLLELKDNDLIPDTSVQSVFDESQFFINKYTDEYNSRTFHQLTSSGTYDTFKDYHDVTDSREHVLKLKNRSLRNVLYKNMINIIIPGVPLMYSKASVGDIIKCRFNTTSIESSSDNSDDLIDKQKSGDYIIYAVRHMFRETKHSSSVNCTKITKDFVKVAETK